MELLEMLILLLLGATVWLWLDSLKAREIGVKAAQAACAGEGLQFLDDTVAIHSLKPVRDADGRLRLRRVYTFEYSDTGDNRRPGSVVMLGQRLLMLNVGLRLVSDADRPLS